jgi:hypothetical protein
VWPEGLSQSKIPVTASGIQPVTIQLVAQRLNPLCHRIQTVIFTNRKAGDNNGGKVPELFYCMYVSYILSGLAITCLKTLNKVVGLYCHVHSLIQ